MTFPPRLPDPDGQQPDYFDGGDRDDFPGPSPGVGALVVAFVIVSLVAFAGLWLDANPDALAIFAGRL